MLKIVGLFYYFGYFFIFCVFLVVVVFFSVDSVWYVFVVIED